LGIRTLHGLYSQGEEHFSNRFSHAMSSLMTTELTASPDEAPAAARCLKLVKRYGDVTAVNGLDLEVRAGECFGLLGPNGAGKTTTVEILEGLTAPTGGRVEVLGRAWGVGDDNDLRQHIGVQLQETQLAEKLTVAETTRLFRSFYHRGRDVDAVIHLVELDEKRDARVGKLSGGQRQRLAVACALVSDPDLLFLDEPTTGLDPQARLKLWGVIEEFRRGGGTIILTTHYMEEAARLCDRVAIMDHGCVIALGTPDELIAALGADQIVEFTVAGTLQEQALVSLPGVRGVHGRDGSGASHGGGLSKVVGYALTVTDIGLALPALLDELEQQHAKLVTLTTHQATLEDVFVSLTGRMLRND
jgi:ABC-2 type transport system ATP-binding protein